MEYERSLYKGNHFNYGKHFAVVCGITCIIIGFLGANELNLDLIDFAYVLTFIFGGSLIVHILATKGIKCPHCNNRLKMKILNTTTEHVQESGFNINEKKLSNYTTMIIYCKSCQKYTINEIACGS